MKASWTTIVSCHNRAYGFEMNASERICATSSQIGNPDRNYRIRLADSIGTILSKRMCSYLNERPDRDHTASKRNRSYQTVGLSVRITSYSNLNCQRNPTISYEWTIVAFVTDRTTMGTLHKSIEPRYEISNNLTF